MSPPRRGVCHQCGRSFELRPMGGAEGPTSGDASSPLSEPLGGLVCRHCGSEFVELLEPKRTRSREARAEADPPSGSDYDDGDGDEYEYDDDDNDDDDDDDDDDGDGQTQMGGEGNIIDGTRYAHEGRHDPRSYQGYHHHRHRPRMMREGSGSGSGGGFVIHSFPGGILLRGGTLPMTIGGRSPSGANRADADADDYAIRQLSFADMIRFVVNPGSFPPEHPVWRTVGFRGNPADYVFSEEAFQTALSSLMDQTGMRTVGLTEEQLDDLERIIWEEEEGEQEGKKTNSEGVIKAEDGSGHERNTGTNERSAASSSSSSPACAICQEPYKRGEETIVLACRHQFHADCICPWLAKVASCPICRHDPLRRGA